MNRNRMKRMEEKRKSAELRANGPAKNSSSSANLLGNILARQNHLISQKREKETQQSARGNNATCFSNCSLFCPSNTETDFLCLLSGVSLYPRGYAGDHITVCEHGDIRQYRQPTQADPYDCQNVSYRLWNLWNKAHQPPKGSIKVLIRSSTHGVREEQGVTQTYTVSCKGRDHPP